MSEDWRTRISIEPAKRSGQPCIRNMRLAVADVLGYLSGGMTVEELLVEFPELTQADVQACFDFAADHPRADVSI